MNTLEQVLSSVQLSINKVVYCKPLEAEAVLCVSIQLLGQQSHTGLADHTAMCQSSSSKDRTCGNSLWAQGSQITPAVRGHNFSRSLFFFPYITKEVTVQEMLKDPFRQTSLGDFNYEHFDSKMFIILQAAKRIWSDSCQQKHVHQKYKFWFWKEF